MTTRKLEIGMYYSQIGHFLDRIGKMPYKVSKVDPIQKQFPYKKILLMLSLVHCIYRF
jgi:hypothetical protein